MPQVIDPTLTVARSSATVDTINADLARSRALHAEVIKRARDSHEKRLTLVFAPGKESARSIAAELNLRGCRAAAIDGDTAPAVRRALLKEFHDGVTRVMVNCKVLTTGFDEPLIDRILIAKVPESELLYVQMIGRGLRGPENGAKKKEGEPDKTECVVVTFSPDGTAPPPGAAWFESLWPEGRPLA